jgi:hypothetical protein
MSQPEFWDFPPTRRYYGRVDVTVTRHRQPSLVMPAVIIVTVFVLWRFKLGLLMLAALTGWPMIAAVVTLVVIIALMAWRKRRAGRPS